MSTHTGAQRETRESEPHTERYLSRVDSGSEDLSHRRKGGRGRQRGLLVVPSAEVWRQKRALLVVGPFYEVGVGTSTGVKPPSNFMVPQYGTQYPYYLCPSKSKDEADKSQERGILMGK